MVNSTLRAGLAAGAPKIDLYSTPVFDLGVRPEVDLTKALALAAALDDEETIRKLDVGK